MGDPLTIIYALVGAAIYATIGIIEKDPKEKFNPDYLVPTFISSGLAGLILFLTGQEMTSNSVQAFVLGNVGLSAFSNKIYNILKARLFPQKPAPTPAPPAP